MSLQSAHPHNGLIFGASPWRRRMQAWVAHSTVQGSIGSEKWTARIPVKFTTPVVQGTVTLRSKYNPECCRRRIGPRGKKWEVQFCSVVWRGVTVNDEEDHGDDGIDHSWNFSSIVVIAMTLMMMRNIIKIGFYSLTAMMRMMTLKIDDHIGSAVDENHAMRRWSDQNWRRIDQNWKEEG